MSAGDLNWFDWLVLALLAWSVIAAFLRGILMEVITLAGLAAGILLAAWNYRVMSGVLAKLIPSTAAANVTAFLLIAVGVMILAAVIGHTARRTADAIGLGFFDRLGGAAFGFVRGCLLVVAVLMAAAAFLPGNQAVKNSRLAPYFLASAHAVSFVVPQDLREQIAKGVEDFKHNVPGWIKQ
jgi:membrane protein required for colicin V production